MQARILRFEEGNLDDHKNLGDGVWEARLTFGPGYRVYFGKSSQVLFLLLLGGDKGSQSKDIKRARVLGDVPEGATGVKEFADSIGMPSPNVLRAIHPKHNPTQETLERLLKPFGLRIGLAEIRQRRRGRAA